MIRILYFSTAETHVGNADVADIVETSAKKNKAQEITGALAFNGRNFCQVLEGEAKAVRALIETIRKDTRHSGFKVIDEKSVEARHFPDWSMHRVSDLDFSDLVNAMRA